MDFGNFDVLQYANHFKLEFEKAYRKKIEEYIQTNPNKNTIEMLEYISYQFSSMALDCSINLLQEYHLHLTEYLNKKAYNYHQK
jgi:hypothetical protein